MKNLKYNRIAAVMVEVGIGNALLADYLGVSIETISKWRQNRAQPSVYRLYKIAEFFKIDVRTLLTERNWEPGPSPAELAKIEEEEKKRRKKKKSRGRKK